MKISSCKCRGISNLDLRPLGKISWTPNIIQLPTRTFATYDLNIFIHYNCRMIISLWKWSCCDLIKAIPTNRWPDVIIVDTVQIFSANDINFIIENSASMPQSCWKSRCWATPDLHPGNAIWTIPDFIALVFSCVIKPTNDPNFLLLHHCRVPWPRVEHSSLHIDFCPGYAVSCFPHVVEPSTASHAAH